MVFTRGPPPPRFCLSRFRRLAFRGSFASEAVCPCSCPNRSRWPRGGESFPRQGCHPSSAAALLMPNEPAKGPGGYLLGTRQCPCLLVNFLSSLKRCSQNFSRKSVFQVKPIRSSCWIRAWGSIASWPHARWPPSLPASGSPAIEKAHGNRHIASDSPARPNTFSANAASWGSHSKPSFSSRLTSWGRAALASCSSARPSTSLTRSPSTPSWAAIKLQCPCFCLKAVRAATSSSKSRRWNRR